MGRRRATVPVVAVGPKEIPRQVPATFVLGATPTKVTVPLPETGPTPLGAQAGLDVGVPPTEIGLARPSVTGLDVLQTVAGRGRPVEVPLPSWETLLGLAKEAVRNIRVGVRHTRVDAGLGDGLPPTRLGVEVVAVGHQTRVRPAVAVVRTTVPAPEGPTATVGLVVRVTVAAVAPDGVSPRVGGLPSRREVPVALVILRPTPFPAVGSPRGARGRGRAVTATVRPVPSPGRVAIPPGATATGAETGLVPPLAPARPRAFETPGTWGRPPPQVTFTRGRVETTVGATTPCRAKRLANSHTGPSKEEPVPSPVR